MFRRRSLPPPLDIEWPMTAWQDADLELRYERAHMILTIEHEIVRGVTPAMLDWWFRHIGGEMEVDGRRYSRYRVWHPLDHIDWQLVGGDRERVGIGSRFRIVEALDRRSSAWSTGSSQPTAERATARAWSLEPIRPSAGCCSTA